MKYQKEKIIIIISIICSVFLGTILWEYINFSFSDPQIIGVYSDNNHDSKNDIFRYIFFISLPLITYLGLKFYFDPNFYFKVKFFLTKDDSYHLNKDGVFLFFLIIVALFILNFFSIDFPNHKLDSYHDGQRLSSAYKSLLDGSLWSGSYVTVGIFYETLAAKFIWQIFDTISIGLSRYTEIISIFLLKFCLIVLSFCLTKFIYLEKFYKQVFFLINSFIFLSLSDYDISSIDLITFRELPIIILLILFTYLLTKKNQTLVLFLIAFLGVLSFLWGIDRGLIYNLITIVILLYLFFIKEYKNILIFISFYIFFWLIFYLIFKDEFIYFIYNTISIYKEMNYVHGLIHPTPFSNEPNSSRATKTIISILLCIILSLSLIFKSNKNFSNLFKKILLLISIICFGSYLYALGRSDGAHIKHIFGFSLIFLSIYFSYIILIKISKKKFVLSQLSKSSLFFILFLLFLFFPIKIDLNKIYNYKSRFLTFVNLPDEHYMNKKEINFKQKIEPLIENYSCIQLFSNDAAFYYILRKKSCTKFYFVWSASSLKKQKEFISELTSAQIIIANGPKDYWDIPLSEKLYLVNDFIKKRYSKIDTINFWDIYIKD